MARLKNLEQDQSMCKTRVSSGQNCVNHLLMSRSELILLPCEPANKTGGPEEETSWSVFLEEAGNETVFHQFS